MRLIDLDAIMAQFLDADFDGDVIENMKAYPYWKIGIDGLINILKDVPIIEQSEDCISREAVNVLIDELARAISDERCYMSRGRSTATIMQDILDLPSVTPQPKKGKWIYIETDFWISNCNCSECGFQIDCDEAGNFCPNCGAKMEVEV